ncbi:hypothetical protein ACFW04_000338 [Cataglyphis niger]
MILIVLFSLAFSFGRDVIASSRVDDVIVRFIINATPVLFPPSRLSLQLCIGYDDTIKLSRILSKNHLTHNIRDFYEEFNPRIYNNLEHRNLYVLDLDCDYASDVLRQITNPNTINHLTDFKDKSIDAVAKAGYPSVVQLAERMNATISFETTNSWGYRTENGSWSGMIGMLERQEIDIGGTASFLVRERIGVVQYIQLYTHTQARFVFRRPLLSSVSNIFILPFQQNVWIAIAVFLILVLCLLYSSIKLEYHRNKNAKSADYWKQLNPSKQTFSDNLLIILGAFAQQGYAYEPYRVSPRIVTLMLLFASLSLYAAYTANIVGLLQSTTDSIKTLSDLLNSPLKLGAQDIVYNRYYFKSFQDPVRKAIVEQRIEPKGRKSNWMSMEEGASRIKNELFAFHSEIGSLYQLIEATYLEEEKCGLTEINFLKVPDPLLVIQIQSPYSEIIKNGALKLQEYGLKYRAEYRLYTRKPICSSKTSFITIGFMECYFALVIMGYGILLTTIVFALELLWHKKKLVSRADH